MKKSSSSSKSLGSFLSPGEPNYKEKTIKFQKGCNSERVSQPEASSRRHSSTVSSLSPFNSGRTIPSKWDDAERWISSPSSNNRNSYAQFQRRPKSKSGPIVPAGTGYYYSNYSPTNRKGLFVKNLMMGSPFTTGVFAPDALSLHHFYSHGTVFGQRYDIDNNVQYSSSPVFDENGVALPSLSSAPLWSELMCDPSSPNSQDEKRDEAKNESTAISLLSEHDRGTQMSSPETKNDAESSSKSLLTSATDKTSSLSSKLEVRDVQVDSEATVIRCSKSNGTKQSSPLHGKDLKKSSTEAQASGLDIAESTMDISNSKLETKEAKIIAWESVQKAKAEAAIRKLEMKLEKKKSSSMDKILNKLRRAQIKAEKMRSSIPTQQVSKTRKVLSFSKFIKIWSPSTSCCFGSHAT